MRNLSPKQIEQVKLITCFTTTKYHGNVKKIGSLSLIDIKAIVAKKQRRSRDYYPYDKKLKLSLVRYLLNWSQETKGTNYFKIMIEGNNNIYYAHPEYGHRDYNKSRLFEKNDDNLKIMKLFNAIVLK